MNKETIINEAHDYFFKIGSCEVGKTCLWQNYVKEQCTMKTVPTIGVEFEVKYITLSDGSRIKAQIWDTGEIQIINQQVLISISSHYRKSVGALLLYDLTNQQSFQNLDKWLDDLKKQAEPDIQIMLVGNKLDIVQKNPLARKVMEEDAKLYAQSNNLKHIEVSAATSENIQQCFNTLFQDLCKQKSGFRGGEQSQLKLMRYASQTQEKSCKC